MKERYDAPKVSFIQFDTNDILTASKWDFNCQSYGQGDNAAPPDCDVVVHTDNSQN